MNEWVASRFTHSREGNYTDNLSKIKTSNIFSPLSQSFGEDCSRSELLQVIFSMFNFIYNLG